MDEGEDLGDGEGAEHEGGGDRGEVDGLEGEGGGTGKAPSIDRFHRAQVLEEAGAGLLERGVVVELDPLTILVASGVDGADGLVGRHAYCISMLISMRFG